MPKNQSRFSNKDKVKERKLVLSDSCFGKIGAAKSFRLEGTLRDRRSRFGEVDAPAIDSGAAIRFVATLRDRRFPGSNSDEAPPPVQVFSTYFSTNKALEPTSPAVTIRAGARLAPAAAVAHL